MKDNRRQLVCEHLTDSLCLLTRECVLGLNHMMRVCKPNRNV